MRSVLCRCVVARGAIWAAGGTVAVTHAACGTAGRPPGQNSARILREEAVAPKLLDTGVTGDKSMTPRLPYATALRFGRVPRAVVLAGESGHTLLELVSVVAVVLILLANAVPSFSQLLAGYALKGAARQVFADFQRTRMAAITQNNRYIVNFTDTHTYTVHDDTNNNGTVDTGETVTTYDLQKDWPGVTLGATVGTLTFYPDATASAAATLTVTNSRGTTSTVTVNAAGYVYGS